MSVQVKRRRESAAFLAGYVGAQGELLVDTTNNRVQVHDGTTSGGWPAATIGDLLGRNVVINGNFPINQRLYASGTALAAGAYAHDRWKAGSGGCTYTFTQAMPDTIVTITAGSLMQVVEGANVSATSFWLSWTGTAPVRAYQGSASSQTIPAYTAGTSATISGITVNTLLVGVAVGTSVALEFGAGTLGLVQFEVALPNAGPTRFERRLGELTLCQRYYFAYAIGQYFDYFQVIQNGAPYLGIPFSLPVTMRATPTVTLTGGTNGTFASGMPSLSGNSSSRLYIRGDTTSTTALAFLLTLTASAEL